VKKRACFDELLTIHFALLDKNIKWQRCEVIPLFITLLFVKFSTFSVKDIICCIATEQAILLIFVARY